jgi:hypothetical protein
MLAIRFIVFALGALTFSVLAGYGIGKTFSPQRPADDAVATEIASEEVSVVSDSEFSPAADSEAGESLGIPTAVAWHEPVSVAALGVPLEKHIENLIGFFSALL